MNTKEINIDELDVIYLSYDEPQREKFWIEIQNIVPWAHRVDGIKGSDSAHKAAAEASSSERFILIDGDNLPDPKFFNQQLELDNTNINAVFRWRALNHINGLRYGNGGVSCWTREFVRNMRTHENTDGKAETVVEFCFDPNYIAMHDCYSTTYPNGSPFQAWRAGFREGVKMSLDRGRRPSVEEFNQAVHERNYDHLCVWQSVGRDVDNGQYAIHGARIGTWLTMLTDWDYTQVQDFDLLKELYGKYSQEPIEPITELLKSRLGLPILELDAKQSAFFKHHYTANFKNKGIMTYEIRQ